ncbi:hypothetical protein EJ08DRAFT_46370 [Tothia fuscella]|uniref:Uncharacterized protein n=1 Tax=Tothia fuscella TaxID=1048955 RepID=A0A9P4TSQ8_9PEZI|nr:hypothetical protein EJ08DRAFT_46370 [Tothia fuscella]
MAPSTRRLKASRSGNSQNTTAISSQVPKQAIMSHFQTASTQGSGKFDPNLFFYHWNDSLTPQNNDLRTAINKAFGLRPEDDYVYHAVASVTLAQAQVAIDHGDVNGLHAWYRDEIGQQIPPPQLKDIEAYTQIFSPLTSTTKALTALAANAKKGSLRDAIAQHLNSNLLPPASTTRLSLPAKQKTPIKNPYYDIWAWSCRCLEWAGPTDKTVMVRQSHHILPIFYHHFGCVCPTWDALSLITQLAKPPGKAKNIPINGRPIIEIGSGNGYWAHMLRGVGCTVYPVDNAASAWRTTWINDTIITDGIQFLQRPPVDLSGSVGGSGCKDAILLLVYPQVSADFTGRVIRTYQGDYIVVAGTQNGNGFTGFPGETISSWMKRERPQFEKVVQIPLPSFAGKDEALFIFMRRSG